MKIGLIGKICSGKTTLANYIMERHCYTRMAFADKIKELATDIFEMQNKDRKLLQNIGTKFREIDEDIWVKYLVRKVKNEDNIIVDDCRYLNEVQSLKNNGFYIIYIDISKETQKNRILNTYSNAEEHLNNLNHSSESNFEKLKQHSDLIINGELSLQIIYNIINKNFKSHN